MLLVLDYDGTYTRDPLFWDAAIALCAQYKHDIIVATMRHEHEGAAVREDLGHLVKDILFTSRLAKHKHVYAAGYNPSVWIDDRPDYICADASACLIDPQQENGILLAIDYDDTYTRAPRFWDEFLVLLRTYGHHAICVTARHGNQSEQVSAALTGKVDAILYSEGRSKRLTAEAHGFYPSIWVDDQPSLINVTAPTSENKLKKGASPF
jgi:hypothetical protein